MKQEDFYYNGQKNATFFFETLDRFASFLVLCGAKRLLNTIPYLSLEVR